MTKFCVYCGKEVEENDNVCGNCGKAINNDIQNTMNVIYKNKTDGFAITGFVLSIISIVSCGISSILGLIFSIIGLSNCNKNNKDGKGFAIAGIIISAIMIFALILLCIFLFAITYSSAELY